MHHHDKIAKTERILIKFKENDFYIDFVGETRNENKLLNSTKLILHLNLAASYLKAEDYFNTLKACEIALKFDPCNLKALFRSARAKISKPQPGKRSDILLFKKRHISHFFNFF